MKSVKKVFINGNKLINLSFKLAKKVYDSDYKPDLMIFVGRGGYLIGPTIHEFFTFKGYRIEYFAIGAFSYISTKKRNEKVIFTKFDHTYLKNKKRILVIDDVLDEGRTLESIIHALPQRAEKRIAVLGYKPSHNKTKLIPDYFILSTNLWIDYPHELMDLSPQDIKRKGMGIYKLIYDNKINNQKKKVK